MANVPLRQLTVAELLRQCLSNHSLMCECTPEAPTADADSAPSIKSIQGKKNE